MGDENGINDQINQQQNWNQQSNLNQLSTRINLLKKIRTNLQQEIEKCTRKMKPKTRIILCSSLSKIDEN